MAVDSTGPTMLPVGGDTELCVEAIGHPSDDAILLIAGATWSMDWWEDELCRRLAGCDRLVVRYDQRDTGESSCCPAGSPDYTGADLVTDAARVLDGLGIARAHVVGLSMGGGIAQALALEHRDRLASLTLMSTSPIDPGSAGLPGPTPQLAATFTDQRPAPDWGDRDAVIDYIVEGERPYAGPRFYDEPRLRAIAGRVVDRSRDMAASLTNHFLIDGGGSADASLSRLDGLRTLVLHGTADPLFPPAHGRALAAAIPGARLIELDGVGHQLPPPPTWDRLVDALIRHTGDQ